MGRLFPNFKRWYHGAIVVPTSIYCTAIGDDKIVYAKECSFSGCVVWLIFLGNDKIVFCHFSNSV